MFDTERFISEIHSRECIWNLSLKDYGDRNLRRLAWEDVASIMYEDWETYSPTQKNETVLQLQKKWKHLRDYFVRERNKEKKNRKGGVVKKRRTPYLDMLQFLTLARPSNTSTANIPSPLANSSDSDSSFNGEAKNENVIDSLNLDTSSEQSSDSKPIQTKKVRKRKRLPQLQNRPLNATNNLEENNMNPHLNFFLSLLPDMQTMSERQIFEFKFEIMKVLQRIKYSNHNMSSYIPSTSICQDINDPLEAPIIISKKEPQ